MGKKTKFKVNKVKTPKRGVALSIINWDEEYKKDIATGKGFRITEPAIKHQSKLYNGIQSERFGADFDSDEGMKYRYRCVNGCTTGKLFNGSTCPECGTKVEMRDIDLQITGWMVLDNDHIIHPIYYNKLTSVIGEKVFTDIITFDKSMGLNGELEEKADMSSPFYGIGPSGFHDRFEEIMAYFKRKKKNKAEEIKEIVKNKDTVFSHCIPVYSALLRPMSFNGESLFYSSIDKAYNKLFTSINLLNDIDLYTARLKKLTKVKRERMDRGNILTKIQLSLMLVWGLVFEQIDGKYGQIQGEILGGMLNWSSRCVIVPNPYTKADEIVLNYHAFLELFKFEIVAHIRAINKVKMQEAINQVEYAKIFFNPKIYQIMKYMISKEKRYVLINRNPTINYGSVLCVRIKDVTSGEGENYTMGMPEQILIVMNADFDGDVLNIISLKSKHLAKAYNKIFNPRFNLFISRNDGNFNTDMNLFKDQLIGLYQFNNI